MRESNNETTKTSGAHGQHTKMTKNTDQPEVALRYYRRLLQMGANSPEVWQNLGLCCFYAAQYDMSLKCLESALAAASDDIAADIW